LDCILDHILKLGDLRLYLVSDPVTEEEINGFNNTISLMADCIAAFRERYGHGRAIWMASLPPCGPLTIYLSGAGINKLVRYY
jgi:hypothetical protein